MVFADGSPSLKSGAVAAITAVVLAGLWHNLRPSESTEPLFTKEQLAKYNGVEDQRLYLAILGQVFDVSAGNRHYAPGATYHAFVGADHSLWFTTGPPGDLTIQDGPSPDAVLHLPCADLVGLQSWLQTYHTKYVYKGRLVGRYYDITGHETSEATHLAKLLEDCAKSSKTSDEHPPCNVEWSATTGSRVWCSRASGGVKREWVGLPRIARAADGTTHCVCIQQDSSAFRHYPGCKPSAKECFVKD